MAGWLIPALKAVLPHVGTIVSAASPAFTRKISGGDPPTTELQQQITELQAAATANDAHIKELAREIKNAVELLETDAAAADARHRRMLALLVITLLFSLAALVCAIYALAS